MIIQLWCDTGLDGCRHEETIDTVCDWGMQKGEWAELDADEQYQHVEEWMWNCGIECGWDPAEED